MFHELQAHKLLVNGKKSEIFLEEIHYLGHIISKDGIRMAPAKIKAIQEWPELRTVHEIRSFLGLCSYYWRFIRHFAEIAAPLHDLSKKNSVFRWGERQKTAFLTLKEKLTTESILVVLDLYKSFEVHCDACEECIGAALHQDGHVVAYESRRLQNAEKHM